MDRTAYDHFTEQLIENLKADPRVIGLVAAGSMADLSRVDRWSDHDFFVITQSGFQEIFRTELDWLPNHARIVINIRETEHGLKIIYDDGHLLEFAVFDLAELAHARINAYKVLLDHGDIAERCAQLQHQSEPAKHDLMRDYLMFLALLLVGAGRCVRGEKISGSVFIKTYALGHLLHVLAGTLYAAEKARLDNLDIYRRFEFVFPEAGAAINQALLHEPISAARELLQVADAYLRERLPNYPADGVATIRQFLQDAAQA